MPLVSWTNGRIEICIAADVSADQERSLTANRDRRPRQKDVCAIPAEGVPTITVSRNKRNASWIELPVVEKK